MSFRQAVYLVVEQDDIQVYIASDCMDKMVTADSQAVSVAGNQPDTQIGASRLHAGSDSGATSVDRMETVCVHIIRLMVYKFQKVRDF